MLGRVSTNRPRSCRFLRFVPLAAVVSGVVISVTVFMFLAPVLATKLPVAVGEKTRVDRTAIDAYLKAVDGDYSPEQQMLGMPFRSPGYHSQVAGGTWVHPTRESLNYAAALLVRNQPAGFDQAGGANRAADADRAADVIRKVLSLQDTDPEHKTYGIWPWLLEEPLEKMAPPDFNWADFCGATIALILVDHGTLLSDDLKQAMRASLGHAVRAIRKRNVQPSYTNIAIMGGVVCAAAGELLDDEEMLRYGRDRLERTVEHARHHGGFNEYNSPTYTMVALRECDRALHLVRDPATREAAETLRRLAWQTIAESFHPATGQWAGPHSRTYSDLVFPYIADYLVDQTGAAVVVHPAAAKTEKPRTPELFPGRACPEELAARFQSLPKNPLTIERTFVRQEDPVKSTVGTTWLIHDACLGSVNRSSFWTQRRMLVGYWKTEADPAVVLRMRFLHDGRDFASMGVATRQDAGRTLSLLYPIRNRGDWHPGLDRPKDGIFRAKDFRVRYELRGCGVKAERLDSGHFVLSAGDYKAVILPAVSHFDGREIRWQMAQHEGFAAIEGICYHGPEKEFDFRSFSEVVVAAGLEVLPVDESPCPNRPEVVADFEKHTVRASWDVGQRLEVTARLP